MIALDWTELQNGQGHTFEWLRSIGLDRHDRFRRHQKNIQEMLNARDAGRYEEFRNGLSEEDHRERLWSICESLEFVDAMRPFVARPPVGIERVLGDALQGPVDLANETETSNRGRNATFEIVVAGLLARAGLPVEFRTNPDVLTQYCSRPVMIQCKRPFRFTSVGKNLRDAGKQLREDLRQHQNGLTIIAVSFSRLFNPGNKIDQFSTEDEMNSKLHVDLRRAIDFLSPELEQIKRYGVCGTFFHMGIPGFLFRAHQITYRQIGAMTPVAARKSETAMLQEIATMVKL